MLSYIGSFASLTSIPINTICVCVCVNSTQSLKLAPTALTIDLSIHDQVSMSQKGAYFSLGFLSKCLVLNSTTMIVSLV